MINETGTDVFNKTRSYKKTLRTTHKITYWKPRQY